MPPHDNTTPATDPFVDWTPGPNSLAPEPLMATAPSAVLDPFEDWDTCFGCSYCGGTGNDPEDVEYECLDCDWNYRSIPL